MAQQQDIKALLEKISSGNFTPEEERIAKYWLLKLDEQNVTDLTDDQLEEISGEMWTSLEGLQAHKPQTRRLWPRIAAAASIILALSAGGYLFFNKMLSPVEQQKIAKQEILPGGNKAFLTLGNGQRISLTDAKNGTIASQAGKIIKKTADGMLVYDKSNSKHNVSADIYNTVETPRGGQYQVVLPDGSKVWLNAASSLRYPAAFTGTDRQVELSGEAYFEVAKDKSHPFKVKANKETVEVLGTHFNVNSYGDEPTVRTTLFEGSVKIAADGKQKIIKPGEQSVLVGDQLKIQQADEDEVLAWKNGLFIFNDEPLESIMRKISRWYDMDVQYGDIDRTQAFLGGISRFSNMSKVLQKLESTKTVHFKIQGKTIYVSK